MIPFDMIRTLTLALPETVEGTSWGSPSFKVNGEVILYWNATLDAPVFKVDLDERDFLIDADPGTFFTTDHHRHYPVVLARPDRLDPEWARVNIERVWRAQAKMRTVRAFDAAHAAAAGLPSTSGT